MKAIAARSAWALIAMLAVVGCPKKDETTTEPTKTDDSDDDDSKKKDNDDGDDSKTPDPQPSAKPAKLEPDQPKPAGGGRAAQELDGGKTPADGFAGTDLGAGRAKFVAATDWKRSTAEGFTVFTAADDKARFGAKASTNPSGDLEAAAKALGLSDCKWGTTSTISMGKDNLAADVSDGTCKRGAGDVQAVYASMTDSGALAIGSWDAGGDDKNVFESFRSVTKAATGGVDPIAACCAALMQNAASAPPQFKGAYISAAGACNALRNDPRGRAALASVRGSLGGAQVPAACR